MDSELNKLILQFNSAQADAVKAFELAFQCPRPESTDDFIFRCVPVIREKKYEAHECRVRPHGIGIEIYFGKVSIDFDFGSNGEINRFDAYRLISFVKNNGIKAPYQSQAEVQVALDLALNRGELFKQGKDYYVGS